MSVMMCEVRTQTRVKTVLRVSEGERYVGDILLDGEGRVWRHADPIPSDVVFKALVQHVRRGETCGALTARKDGRVYLWYVVGGLATPPQARTAEQFADMQRDKSTPGRKHQEIFMFEVIISRVKTGRIERKFFDTRDEAEQHIAKKQNSLVNRMRNGKPKQVSLGEYRMEVVVRAAPEVRQVARRSKKARAA